MGGARKGAEPISRLDVVDRLFHVPAVARQHRNRLDLKTFFSRF